MTKQEFEKMVGVTMSQEEYDIIETVYNYYPTQFGRALSKEFLKEMYWIFGIGIFKEMLQTARAEKERYQRNYQKVLLDYLELGYKIICHQEDIEMTIILGNKEEYVIITVDYETLEATTIPLERKIVEKMFLFGKEG